VSTQPDNEKREPVALSKRERAYLVACLAIPRRELSGNDTVDAMIRGLRQGLEAALLDHGVSPLSEAEADSLARLLGGSLDG
jgi:hypothetical protein